MSLAELLIGIEIGLIYGIVAIGIYLTFKIIDFPDLTCDGSFVTGAATSSILIKSGYNPWIAIIFAALSGGLAGLATSILHVYGKITSLLAGILVAFMLYSVNLRIMGGVSNLPFFNNETIFTNYNPLFILITISIFIWVILSYIMNSDFGLSLRAIGQNKILSLSYGVNLSLLTITGIVLSNTVIGLAGGLLSQHQSFGDISQGIGTVITGLAAVILGEKILPFRSIWSGILSCLLGSILYRLIVAAALNSEWIGLKTQDLNLITGIMVVLIMLLPRRRSQENSLC
jgi:putative tryptophan/tyrosine transport system permease protein